MLSIVHSCRMCWGEFVEGEEVLIMEKSGFLGIGKKQIVIHNKQACIDQAQQQGYSFVMSDTWRLE